MRLMLGLALALALAGCEKRARAERFGWFDEYAWEFVQPHSPYGLSARCVLSADERGQLRVGVEVRNGTREPIWVPHDVRGAKPRLTDPEYEDTPGRVAVLAVGPWNDHHHCWRGTGVEPLAAGGTRRYRDHKLEVETVGTSTGITPGSA